VRSFSQPASRFRNRHLVIAHSVQHAGDVPSRQAHQASVSKQEEKRARDRQAIVVAFEQRLSDERVQECSRFILTFAVDDAPEENLSRLVQGPAQRGGMDQSWFATVEVDQSRVHKEHVGRTEVLQSSANLPITRR